MFSDGSIGDLAIGGFVVFVSDDLSSFKHVLSVCTRVIKSFGLLRFSGSGAVQQTGCTWLLFIPLTLVVQNWQVFQYETTQYTLESLIGAKVFFLCGLWVG